MKYKKKPVVIEAVQWNGRNLEGIKEFVGDSLICNAYGCIEIKTLEGNHICTEGDYIIKGIQGEFYPCKPDIFEQTYEQAGEQDV